MRINVKTKARQVWSQEERTMARAAVEYGLCSLGLWHCPTRMTVILRDFKEGHFGDSLDLDYKYVIRISKQGNWVKTIFHELEHIRQYAEDELELEPAVAMWRGEMFEDQDYETSPWEVMAREVEETLYDEFMEAITEINS